MDIVSSFLKLINEGNYDSSKWIANEDELVYIATGDILLIGLWGCLLPFTEMMILLFIASSSGLLYLAITNLFKPQPVKKLPFVPFLFIGLAVCLYLQ